MSNHLNTPESIAASRLNRARGALVGLACGDALGTTLEFCARVNNADWHTEMTGGGFSMLTPANGRMTPPWRCAWPPV